MSRTTPMWCGLITLGALIAVVTIQGVSMIPAADHHGRTALLIVSALTIGALALLGVVREGMED